ncbi:hypothetical protein [Streptomyces sp. MST-110588]|nr:hypothetical protein [Streptomyces sp. MST-110588]
MPVTKTSSVEQDAADKKDERTHCRERDAARQWSDGAGKTEGSRR